MRMTKNNIKKAIRTAIAESKHISLYDTSIFYYMAGYAPEVSAYALCEAINEVRNEVRNEA